MRRCPSPPHSKSPSGAAGAYFCSDPSQTKPNRKPRISTPTARFGVSNLSSRYGECFRKVVGSNRLWVRGQVWLTGIEIDRDRDVFVDHQPIALDLLVNVGHAYGQIQLLALLIGATGRERVRFCLPSEGKLIDQQSRDGSVRRRSARDRFPAGGRWIRT